MSAGSGMPGRITYSSLYYAKLASDMHMCTHTCGLTWRQLATSGNCNFQELGAASTLLLCIHDPLRLHAYLSIHATLYVN